MRSNQIMSAILIGVTYIAFSSLLFGLYNSWAWEWLWELQLPASCKGIYPESLLELRETCRWELRRNEFFVNLAQSLILAGLFLGCMYPFKQRLFRWFVPRFFYVPMILILFYNLAIMLIPQQAFQFTSSLAEGLGLERLLWSLFRSFLWQVVPVAFVYAAIFSWNRKQMDGAPISVVVDS